MSKVIFDARANDGTWCTLPYPDHSRGCPKYPRCIRRRPEFRSLPKLHWFALIEPFNIAKYAKEMMDRHKGWSERQARCVLWWQKKVVGRLLERARACTYPILGDIVLDVPEASGVNVFATIAKHGLYLKSNPTDILYKIVFVGKKELLRRCRICEGDDITPHEPGAEWGGTGARSTFNDYKCDGCGAIFSSRTPHELFIAFRRASPAQA